MSIIIVAGPPASGKSTFIKENFKDKEIVDLYDFQKDKPFLHIDTIWESYVECKDAVIKAIQDGKEVVMEHTLLKAIRREYYINEFRKVTNEDIIIYFFVPEKEDYKKRLEKRELPTDDGYIKLYFDTMEIPTKEEGFKEVIICK